MTKSTWLRRAGRFALALAAAWLCVLSFLSLRYAEGLLNPPCPAGLEIPPQGFQSIKIRLPDRLELRGWWRPPQNGAVVVLMGGHGANRDALLPEARMLAAQGYGALTIDYRNCAGQPAALGAWETEEFHAALDFVELQAGVEWIAALGFSAGGSAVIRGSVERPEVRAVIAEGHYANLGEEILQRPPAPLLSLPWQLQRVTALVLWARLGISPWEVSPIDALSSLAPRPVLLIFGENESTRAQAEAQYRAAGDPKILWIVPGADHGEYLAKDPAGYEWHIIEFLNQSRKINP